jgi:hypothetical protein
VTYCYFAYGLNVESDLPLPGLLEPPGAGTDLRIQLGQRPSWLVDALGLASERLRLANGDSKTDEPVFILHALGGGHYFHLRYSDGTEFVTDAAATRLWGGWKPPLTIEDLLTYLLGPVMGFLLRLRGTASLHASCVEIAGRAVAFVGPAGAGKSTTAAALALRGHAVLSEDVSPLLEANDGFFVEPGYPRICLWPDAVTELFGSQNALPKLTPNWEKCYFPLDGVRGRFVRQRVPLGGIYVLGEREPDDRAPRLVPLSQREAFRELVQNTYMNYALDRERRATEFDVLTRLVRQVPVWRVVPHADPQRITQLCDLLTKGAAQARMPAASAHASVPA